jgi:hypothetical protein
MEELLGASLDQNFDLQHALDMNIKYYSFDGGKQVQGIISYFNYVASELGDFYNKTCCSR